VFDRINLFTIKTYEALISFLLCYSIVTDNNRNNKKKKDVMWDKLFLGFTQTRRNLSLQHWQWRVHGRKTLYTFIKYFSDMMYIEWVWTEVTTLCCSNRRWSPLQVMWTDTTQDGITHVCQYLSQNATLYLQFHIILVLHVLSYLAIKWSSDLLIR
jgi:hypothetical protein